MNLFTTKKKVWVLRTDVMDPHDPAFKKLVDFIKDLPGFLAAATPSPEGLLWMFDSKDHAKEGKEKLLAFGAKPSPNICRGIRNHNNVALEAIDN